jgi:glycosyltransferase involved in cell wall biosynthesis
MIVKNEERYLAQCLTSVKDVVDEIIIVDTGSTDKTIEIAEKFGAKIFHFDWVDDFSTARNFSLSKCTGDWILYLDADEEINPNCIEEINKYKNNSSAGIYCTIKSIGSSSINGSLIRYPRLFANVPGIEFNGKVHEQIIESLRKNKIPLLNSGIEIIHYGYAIDDDGLKQKKERNLALLISSENNKANIYDKLKLIQTLISLDKYDEAEVRLKKLINIKSLSGEQFGLTFYYMSSIQFEKNNLESALHYGLKAIRYLIEKPELNYHLYLIYLRMNKLDEARKYLLSSIKNNKRILDIKSTVNSENILDQIDLYFRMINLSKMLNDESETKKFIKELSDFISTEKAVDNKIVYSIFENLIMKYLLSYSDADLLSRIINQSHLSLILDIIKSCNDNFVLQDIINVMLQFFPDSAVLYRNLALLLVNDDEKKAIEIFNKSLEIEDNPVVYINLISIYVANSNHGKVIESFNNLQNRFSNNSKIKQKIDLLREKLNPILTASGS